MPTRRHPRAPTIRADRSWSMHELAIRMLVRRDERVCRNGFAQAMHALGRELDDEYEFEPMPVGDFRPDAFLVDRQAQEVVLYEVEDTHALTPVKLDAIVFLWLWFDSDGSDWILRLFPVDRYGNVGQELDLQGYYHAMMPERAY